MKNFMIVIAFFTLILSGCSFFSTKTEYHSFVSPQLALSKNVQPICTIRNSKDGAALSSALGAHLLVKPPAYWRTFLFGPPLLPIIPVHFRTDTLRGNVELQVLPTDGEVLFLSNVEMRFDGRKVDFSGATYRIKGRLNQEVTAGIFKREQLDSEIKIERPYAISLNGSDEEFPEKIEVSFQLRRGHEKEGKLLEFIRKSGIDYRPFVIPGEESDVICETSLPEIGAKRDFL